MGLLIKAADVPQYRRAHSSATGAGEMTVKKVYGKECNIMVAERQPGYHTRPHLHDCEQINYVVQGEIWFFVEDKAYFCQAGDFQRIPRNKIHWAWNKSDQPALVIEAHSPPLLPGMTQSGPAPTGAAGLFDDDESPDVPNAADNIFVDYDQGPAEAKAR